VRNHDLVFLKHFSQVIVFLVGVTIALILLGLYINSKVEPEPNPAAEAATVERIRRELKVGDGPEGFLYRYRHEDDFGSPGSAFVVCSFWLVQALAKLGDLPAARAAMDEALRTANDVGLLAEEYDTRGRRHAGNTPQALSHLALVQAADWIARSSGQQAPGGRSGDAATRV